MAGEDNIELSVLNSHMTPTHVDLKQEMEPSQCKVDALEAKLLEVKCCIRDSELEGKKELDVLWRRVRTAASLMTYLKTKARVMGVPHLANMTCGIKQLDGVGLVDRNGVPLSGWSRDVDLSSFDDPDEETWIKLSSNQGSLDEQDGAYISELLQSVQMVTDVMENLVKRVLMAESETAIEKVKVTIGEEEIRKKALQIENMSVKLEEMERFALGTNCIINEMRQRVEDLVEETSRQRQRAAENDQELCRVKQDFESLKSYVSSLISVRETLLSSEKQFQTIERLFERLVAKTTQLESEKAQKEAEVQKLMEENVKLTALLDKKEAQLLAMNQQCKLMALGALKPPLPFSLTTPTSLTESYIPIPTMPSVIVAEAMASEASSKDLKKKGKKTPKPAAETLDSEKKKSKHSKVDLESDSEGSSAEKKRSKKKEKKRKAAEIDSGDEQRSETSSELVEPVNFKAEKKKKAKLMEAAGSDEEEEEKEEDPNAITNFRISKPLREALKAKGIESLFKIQAMTFDTILDGTDLVGRARTGQGKTLAFVLPILESLTNGPAKATRKTGYGRPPSVIVLLPTRELALQVFTDFEVYGGALGLTSCCLYGNTPYAQQEIKLKRGVDIVVGTPGRIKDHIMRGNIDLTSLKFRVLDEVDEMLRIGFVEDVEFILGKVEDLKQVQTLLFSATLQDWVKHIASKFLKPDKKTVDIVGNEKMKASTSVRHIIIPCSISARSQLIPDIIRCYSSGGRTIIFTETKGYASELAGLLPGARALHGDIQQSQREVTLAGFRSGKFLTLVATNVAARGLDIDNVQLIIQCEPPRDVEAYIHRSGRTGRAGNTGVAVMLYDPKKSNISRIERESGVKFEHIAAPQPADIAKAIGEEAAEQIAGISDSVIPAFKAAAESLLNTSDLSPADLLAKALAKAAGYTEIKSRSLLTSMENCVTLQLESGKPVYSPSFVYNVLKRFLSEETAESIKGLTLTADGKGAVFDVSTEDVDTFIESAKKAYDISLEVVKTLPPLQEREQSRGGRFGGGGRGFSDRRGGRFSGGRGGRGGFSDRRRGGGSGGRGHKW